MHWDYYLRHGLRYLSPEELPEFHKKAVADNRFETVRSNDFAWLDPGRFSEEGYSSWREKYEAYLQSPQWERMRAIALYLANNQCVRRGARASDDSPLEVHHKTYKHLCHEPQEDLEVLCAQCHKQADQERAASSKKRQQRSGGSGSMNER